MLVNLGITATNCATIFGHLPWEINQEFVWAISHMLKGFEMVVGKNYPERSHTRSETRKTLCWIRLGFCSHLFLVDWISQFMISFPRHSNEGSVVHKNPTIFESTANFNRKKVPFIDLWAQWETFTPLIIRLSIYWLRVHFLLWEKTYCFFCFLLIGCHQNGLDNLW